MVYNKLRIIHKLGGATVKIDRTDQRAYLLAFLRRYAHRQFTVEELVTELDGVLAKSTIYRLMGRLVEEGEVRRFARDDRRQFLYQALADNTCHSHLHLKCTACGRLIHLDEDTSEAVIHILDKTEFCIDEGKTLLLGQCKGCRMEGV